MNRRTVMNILAGASLMTAAPAMGHAQNSSDAVTDADRVAVRAWLGNCVATWALGDSDGMFRMATDDLEWINTVGLHWHGKAQVLALHNIYLNTMFKGVPMSLKSIESLRSMGPDIVVAVVRWSVGQFNPPDGSTVPAADDRMTLVFRRTAQGLQLAHGANVTINAVAEGMEASHAPPPRA